MAKVTVDGVEHEVGDETAKLICAAQERAATCIRMKSQPGAEGDVADSWQESADAANEHARIILSYYFESTTV